MDTSFCIGFPRLGKRIDSRKVVSFDKTPFSEGSTIKGAHPFQKRITEKEKLRLLKVYPIIVSTVKILNIGTCMSEQTV